MILLPINTNEINKLTSPPPLPSPLGGGGEGGGGNINYCVCISWFQGAKVSRVCFLKTLFVSGNDLALGLSRGFRFGQDLPNLPGIEKTFTKGPVCQSGADLADYFGRCPPLLPRLVAAAHPFISGGQ
jgi:hypothetical protein